jgi:hypothetical protein
LSISSDDDTDSTEVLGSEYDSQSDSDVDMHMEDDVDTLDGVDLDGYVDMEVDSNYEEEEDEEEEDEQEEDEDEDDGKNLGRLARETWEIHRLMLYIPWYMISQSCYLNKPRRCASIPQRDILQHLPHGHKPRSLAHTHELQTLIP